MHGQLILFPYYLALKIRHAMYDRGFLFKSKEAEIPTICIGNVTVGGTGKTPHTEMILDTLMRTEEWGRRNLAVLSRGYKRKTRGFRIVDVNGEALAFGDEPVQIKRNYPWATVAVDKDRINGCDLLAHPEKSPIKTYPAADLVVLDDAFQYRRLKATVNIVLVDYNHPVSKDRLMPLGRLRDLPERIGKAQIVIVTKCPLYMQDDEKQQFALDLKIREDQKLFFTSIDYSQPKAIFLEDCNSRYIYSNKAIVFSGIAGDTPLVQYLSGTYKVVKRLGFGDHHRYRNSDIRAISAAIDKWPTAAVITTEKDAQRIREVRKLPHKLKERLFKVPIKVAFLEPEDAEDFRRTLLDAIRVE
ncbi:MAG: tetraacyldisaccharide 4'-kinase [Bacteroidales bacterium]|nr:tetraacyldisaccharide 4'-kinase [Bacteroidales bacterium]